MVEQSLDARVANFIAGLNTAMREVPGIDSQIVQKQNRHFFGSNPLSAHDPHIFYKLPKGYVHLRLYVATMRTLSAELIEEQFMLSAHYRSTISTSGGLVVLDTRLYSEDPRKVFDLMAEKKPELFVRVNYSAPLEQAL